MSSSGRAILTAGLVKGVIAALGGVRTYRAWCRNDAAYCTPSTFNLSNGWQVVWGP